MLHGGDTEADTGDRPDGGNAEESHQAREGLRTQGSPQAIVKATLRSTARPEPALPEVGEATIGHGITGEGTRRRPQRQYWTKR